MKYLQLLRRGGRLAFFAIICVLAMQAPVLAANYDPEAARAPKVKKQEGDFVVSYALVMAGLALGLLAVCRPSLRRDRARPEHYEESNVTETE